MHALVAYVAAHWVAILTVFCLVASEAMPFLPTKANGVVQMLVNLAKLALSKKGPALKSVAILPLAFVALSISGCAQYSACVKAAVTPAVKAVSLAQLEQQVTMILNTAVSGAWVQAGLTAVEDACLDTNCRALVGCVTQAWQETHPTAKPAAKAGAQTYLSAHATDGLECGRLQLASR